MCGGVILNRTHVLTAGSCVTDEEDEAHDFLPGLRVNVVGGFVTNEKCNSTRQRSWVRLPIDLAPALITTASIRLERPNDKNVKN